jgi:SpoU rRNA methylase family enzyme
MDKSVGIYFGVFSDPLNTQLKKQGFKYNEKRVTEFEKQRDAINVLRFSDLLTDGMTDKICKKLHSKIVSHVAKENKMKVVKKPKI